jgi:hypothetical protein
MIFNIVVFVYSAAAVLPPQPLLSLSLLPEPNKDWLV